VLLCLPRRSRSRRTNDVRVFRSDLDLGTDAGEVVELDGIPVTSPTRTCADLARLTVPLSEAVAAVDVLARESAQILDDASGWVGTHDRWVGVDRARRALRLSCGGVK